MPSNASPVPEASGLRAVLLRELQRGQYVALLWQLTRFGWVGFFTLGMYAVQMWLLAKAVNWPTWACATVSYVPCLVVNYLLHRSFTFQSSKQHIKAGPRYLAIQLGGLAINSGVLWLCVDALSLPFWPSQTAAIALLAIWSYLGQKLWTFS
jgi:putative flippase GtrA